MKISGIDVKSLIYPLEQEAYDATVRWKDFNWVLVRVETSNGLVGLADIAPLHGREMGIFETIIKKKLERIVVGESPYDLERIWMKMIGKGSSAYALGNKGAVVSAASAIDVALWDIVSQSYGTPLYDILGGRSREKVTVYPSFMGPVPADMLEEIRRRGFKAIKFKVGFDAKKDVEEVKRVREALGDFKMMVDGNQGYDLYQAIDFSERAREFNVAWLEEPINVFNIRDLSILADKSRIPIALGENYYSLHEFSEVIVGGIAGVIQPDINHGGGITQIKKIASIAECYDVKFAPHTHSIIGFVVGLHLLTSTPNGYVAEYPMYGKKWTLRDKFIEKCVKIEGGYAELTCKKGTGIEYDEALIEKYKTV
jgi:L-alanine-DL-glutamate epimerase-like enolase superfamily enzyme